MEDSEIVALYLRHDEEAIAETAAKRSAGLDAIMDELEDCIPSPVTVERRIEELELPRR